MVTVFWARNNIDNLKEQFFSWFSQTTKGETAAFIYFSSIQFHWQLVSLDVVIRRQISRTSIRYTRLHSQFPTTWAKQFSVSMCCVIQTLWVQNKHFDSGLFQQQVSAWHQLAFKDYLSFFEISKLLMSISFFSFTLLACSEF